MLACVAAEEAAVAAMVSATVGGYHRILELLFQYLVALSLAALVAEAALFLGPAILLEFLALQLRQ